MKKLGFKSLLKFKVIKENIIAKRGQVGGYGYHCRLAFALETFEMTFIQQENMYIKGLE